MNKDNIQYIFVNPLTQSFGELLFNNSSESVSLTYDDIITELQKMELPHEIISEVRQKLKTYTPFVINCIDNTVIQFNPEKDDIGLKQEKIQKTLINQAKTKEQTNHNKNNRNSIQNIEKKIDNIIKKDYNSISEDRINKWNINKKFF